MAKFSTIATNGGALLTGVDSQRMSNEFALEYVFKRCTGTRHLRKGARIAISKKCID